ncbi:MAG: hypothetical protein WBB82_04860 [Limnothrix sp.]
MNKITWIISTGNSDIQILNNPAWNGMLSKYKNSNPKYKLKNPKPSLNPKFKVHGKSPYLLEARVLGTVAQNPNDYKTLDLTFPLLDSFANKLKKESIKPDRIIIFLTDQDSNFNEKDKKEMSCPFWQDTYEAQSIFEWYFENHKWLKDATLDFQILKPESPNNFGLSDWDKTLPFLQQVFNHISSQEKEIFYVSHQAGTPAISSAIQFISLNRFGDNTNFLVGNEVTLDSADILESSKYLKYLFIGQAKELLKKGNPAAALQLLNGLVEPGVLKDIEKQIKQFNLKPDNSNPKEEFEPLRAADRVRKSLDLIEIFLENENYLQAIALLAAAHETFLKASISYRFEVNMTLPPHQMPNTITVDGISLNTSEILEWNEQGLRLSFSYISRMLSNRSIDKKIDVLKKLDFLTDLQEKNINFDSKRNNREYIDFKNIAANNALVSWLKNIYPNVEFWDVINEWLSKYERPYKDDLRNQFIHNLRGIDVLQLVGYMKGFREGWKEENNSQIPKDDKEKSEWAAKIFTQEVRSPFIQAMHQIGLISSDETTNHIQEELETLSDRLK